MLAGQKWKNGQVKESKKYELEEPNLWTAS